MITVPSKEILFALPRKPKENELACVENSHTIYKANSEGKWEEVKVDGGLTLSLYELNKTAMAQMSEKPATSTTTADRTSQRPITKERPSTVQRVPLQNTRSRPPIKTATIKKVGKKP